MIRKLYAVCCPSVHGNKMFFPLYVRDKNCRNGVAKTWAFINKIEPKKKKKEVQEDENNRV